MSVRHVLSLSLVVMLLIGCTGYQSREVAFRYPSAYANHQNVAGALVGAEGYADPAKAEKAFGFDIRKAGLLPVQVVIDNANGPKLQVDPQQTFLIDPDGGMWNLLDARTAAERVASSSEGGRVAKGAGRSGMYGAAGGALIGAAIGILTGDHVAESTLKGTAVGAAGGAVVGGSQALSGNQGTRQIARDLANKELENRSIEPGQLGRGFLFFPGEAPGAASLRLQLVNTATGDRYTLLLPL